MADQLISLDPIQSENIFRQNINSGSRWNRIIAAFAMAKTGHDKYEGIIPPLLASCDPRDLELAVQLISKLELREYKDALAELLMDGEQETLWNSDIYYPNLLHPDKVSAGCCGYTTRDFISDILDAWDIK